MIFFLYFFLTATECLFQLETVVNCTVCIAMFLAEAHFSIEPM